MWQKAATRWLILGVLAATVSAAETLPEFRRPSPRRLKSQQSKTHETPRAVRALPIPDDAVKLARADIQTIPPHDRTYIRYVFAPPMDGDAADDVRSMRTTSLALNYVSRSSAIYRPAVVAPWLFRIDLRWYASRDADLREWVQFWEELAFDPAFSLLVTKDAVENAGWHVGAPGAPKTTDRRTVTHPGGKFTYPADSIYAGRDAGVLPAGEYIVLLKEPVAIGGKSASQTTKHVKDVVRYNSRAIDPVAFEELQHETHTEAPVVEHRYLKARILNTIKNSLAKEKDKGKVFEKVLGGLYYEFSGIRLAKDVLGANTKATDLDLFFEDIGLGSIKGGVTADQLFNRIRSDQAAILFKSKVTGKPRDVRLFYTPNGKKGAIGSITGDVADESIDIGDRSFANLINPRRDAREGIFPKPNDLLLFIMTDGKGARQDEVPFNVAQDSGIPVPYTQRLQAMGCITCHSMQGEDGRQPIHNDADKLISERALDVFGDNRRFDFDTIDRIRGLYKGNFDDDLMHARNVLAAATLRATGPWKESQTQADVCKLSAARIHQEYGDYFWRGVDARRALWEIGLDVPKDQALKLFNEIIPPDPNAFTHGVYLEDPRIGAIKAGITVERADFALSRDPIAERASRSSVYQRLRAGK